MQELELSLRFIKPMHEIGVEYMVTGFLAAIVYGEPRITHDIDKVRKYNLNEVWSLI